MVIRFPSCATNTGLGTVFARALCAAVMAIALGVFALPVAEIRYANAQTTQETQPGETEAGETEAGEAEATETQTSKPRTLPAAYLGQLLRLSEALGALHYLRNLCGAEEGQTWRDEMEQLIGVEEPDAETRGQLIAAFNRGFRGYSEIHRRCSPAAIEAANDYLAQGTRIAADIPNRYGR